MTFCSCENEKQNYPSWAKCFKGQLDNLGLGYMRNDQSNINSRICLQIIQKRLQYNFIITLHSTMQIKTKCFIYKHLVDNFCLHCYLEKSIPKLYCSEKWSIIRFQQR